MAAQTASTQPGRSLALLIGIDQYTNAIPQLETAVTDASAIARLLRDLHGYDVVSCCDGHATLAELRGLLGGLASQVGPNDRFLFYFAGHGVAEESDDGSGPQGYLIPQDARREDVGTFLPMAEVQAHLERLRCQHMLVLLDCCFAGAFRWTGTRNLAVRRPKLYRERYERYLREPAWQVLTSTAHDERALDVLAGRVIGTRAMQGRHSPFASALLEALRGAADLAVGDVNGDGVILASELHLYLESSMEKLETATGRPQQRPMLWSLGGRDKGQYLFYVPGRQPNLPLALELTEKNNPYRGLAFYDEGDKDLFFGRGELADELTAQVVAQALTVVVGTSGAGKSSLVRAGLVPRLRARAGENWLILPAVRPGHAPAAALRQLSTALGGGDAWLEQATASYCRANPGTRLLLLIDQLEELVTMGAGPEQEHAFLEMLGRAVGSAAGQVHAVLVMRSDFEPHFTESIFKRYGLGTRFFVRPMTRQELREAVEGPAMERVLSFEPPSLLDLLVNEVVEMPGALPLLSFTLSEMYRAYIRRAGDDRSLTESDYRAVGEVAGALSQRGDALYRELDDAHQATLRRVMLRMLTFEGGEAARRRVLRSEMTYGDAAEDGRVQEVLRRLLEARLVVTGQDTQGEAYVEPAHDKLVLGWRRLWEFLRTEGADLPLHRRLTQAATEWAHDRRGKLWHDDPRLPQLEADLAKVPLRFNALERTFVRRSISRRRWRRVSLASAVIVVMALLGAAALYARARQLQAEDQQRRAEEQRAEAQRRLVQIYREQGRQRLLDGDARQALLYLSEAYQGGADDPATRLLLGQALAAAPPPMVLPHPTGVAALAFSSDGTRLVTAAEDGARVWDAKDGRQLARLLSPTPGVFTAAFSPDGERVVTAHLDHAARIWSVRDAKLLHVLSGHSEWVHSAAFSPDGQRVLTTSNDETARIWSSHDGRLLRVLSGHGAPVWIAAFLPDGERVVTAGGDGTARIWSTQTGALLAKLHHFVASEANVRNPAISPDGALVVTAKHAKAQLWRSQGGAPILTLAGHTRDITSIKLAADGERVLTTSKDGTARIWSLRWPVAMPDDGDLLGRGPISRPAGMDVPVEAQVVTSVRPGGELLDGSFSRDGGRFLTTTADNTHVWDARSGILLTTFSGSGSVAFSPDGTRVATGDSLVRLWTLGGRSTSFQASSFISAVLSTDGTRLLTTGMKTVVWDLSTRTPIATVADKVVAAADLSPDGERVVTVEPEALSARVWNRQGSLLATLNGHTGQILHARFSPDGARVVTASADRTARVWDARSGAAVAVLNGHSAEVSAAQFSADGTRVLTRSRDNTARVWDATSGNSLFTMEGKAAPMVVSGVRIAGTPIGYSTAVFSRDGSRVITAAAGAEVWDAQSGRRLATLVSPDAADPVLMSAAPSPNGEQALATTGNGVVQMWDVSREKIQATLYGRDGRPTTVAFAPGGDLVVTGEQDHSVRLWDPSSGQLLVVLRGHPSPPIFAAFTPNGERLISASPDGTVILWETPRERRPAAEISALAKCYVPFTLADGRPLPTVPDLNACPQSVNAPVVTGSGTPLCGRFRDLQPPADAGLAVASCTADADADRLMLLGAGDAQSSCATMKTWAASKGWSIDIDQGRAEMFTLTLHKDDRYMAVACTTTGVPAGQVSVGIVMAPLPANYFEKPAVCGRFRDLGVRIPAKFTVQFCTDEPGSGRLVMRGPGEMAAVCRETKEWATGSGFAVATDLALKELVTIELRKGDLQLGVVCTTTGVPEGELAVALTLAPLPAGQPATTDSAPGSATLCGHFAALKPAIPAGFAIMSCTDRAEGGALTLAGSGDPSAPCSTVRTWATQAGWIPGMSSEASQGALFTFQKDGFSMALTCAAAAGMSVISISVTPDRAPGKR
jgi:WD40 repeat protein